MSKTPLYLLVLWKCRLVHTLLELEIFERRNYKGTGAFPKFIDDGLALSDAPSKVRADRKINIQHHNEVGPCEETSNVAPRIELSIEGVDNQMDVDISRHDEGGGVKFMEGSQESIHFSRVGLDVYGNRYWAYVRACRSDLI